MPMTVLGVDSSGLTVNKIDVQHLPKAMQRERSFVPSCLIEVARPCWLQTVIGGPGEKASEGPFALACYMQISVTCTKS